jgi:hypothetical protein
MTRKLNRINLCFLISESPYQVPKSPLRAGTTKGWAACVPLSSCLQQLLVFVGGSVISDRIVLHSVQRAAEMVTLAARRRPSQMCDEHDAPAHLRLKR